MTLRLGNKKPDLRKYDFFCFIRLFVARIFVCSVDRARVSSSDENRQKNKHENEWISYSYSYSKTPWANNFMSEWNYAWQHTCHLASYHPIMPLRPLFSWTVWLVAPGSPSKCTPCLRFSKVQSAKHSFGGTVRWKSKRKTGYTMYFRNHKSMVYSDRDMGR